MVCELYLYKVGVFFLSNLKEKQAQIMTKKKENKKTPKKFIAESDAWAMSRIF